MFIVKEENEKNKADIRVIGVGGAGNNMIETMIKDGIKGVEFIAVNTDHQALEFSSAKKKIQIGSKLTKGLGAGANPEVGRRASVESYEEIVNCLKGADMVFVAAGMGGGTGTGSAPFIAQSAHELGILTVGIVTKPFLFEGHKRTKQAKRGISELSQYVDTLIVVPNDELVGLVEKNTPLLETFKLTDEVLLQAVKGISDLVNVPGLINLDFSDIKTVMRDKGMALMGRGSSNGSNRVEKALKLAISSPLLSGLSIQGATGIIVNVTADSSLSLSEFQKASSFITDMADPSADIIVGTVIDESMKDQLSITVIATGFNSEAASIDFSSVSKKDIESEDLSLEESGTQKEIEGLSDNSESDSFKTNKREELKEVSAVKENEEKTAQNTSLNNKDESTTFEDQENQDFLSEKSNENRGFKESLEDSVQELDKDTLSKGEKEFDEESYPTFDSCDKDSSSISTEKLDSEKVLPLLENNSLNESFSSSSLKDETSQNREKPNQALKNKKQSLREILLSKSREYEKNQENQNVLKAERQIDMNLKEEHGELSSPFEAEVELSDQDLS